MAKARGFRRDEFDDDSRNLFPESIRAVRELRPKAVLFENVKGLPRESFAKYFEYILLQITYPDVEHGPGEEWMSHLSRLEKYHTAFPWQPDKKRRQACPITSRFAAAPSDEGSRPTPLDNACPIAENPCSATTPWSSTECNPSGKNGHD
jgi:hypothetical protein